mmetsp:Transcript_25692/g.35893  ORF Transcript_25692/g.35893 Transcript_25692/m.35893 type:complete len:313 (+) Transcript_25692:2-940(+)
MSRISFNSQNIVLGVFQTEIEAARAYNQLAITVNRPVNDIPGDDLSLEPSAMANSGPGEKGMMSPGLAILKEEQEKQRQWRQRVWNPLLEAKKSLTTTEKISQLTKMGHDLECSTLALAECRGNVERASNYLARQTQRLESTGVQRGGGGGGGRGGVKGQLGNYSRSSSSSSSNTDATASKQYSQYGGGYAPPCPSRMSNSSKHAKGTMHSGYEEYVDDRGGLKLEGKIATEVHGRGGVSLDGNSRERRLSWERFFHGMDDQARRRIQALLEKNAVDSIEVLRECETSDFIEMGMLIGDKKRVFRALRDFPQ